MAEHVPHISRKIIEASNEDTAFWHPRWLELSDGPFTTESSKEEYMGNSPTTEIDTAMACLYDDLADASGGILEIPPALGVDQIEDWFIARAIGKGIRIHTEAMKMNAHFMEHDLT